jgi:CSLREA domain-containing protein
MKPYPPSRRLCFRAAAVLLISIVVVAIVSQLQSTQAAGTFTVNSLADTPDAILNGVCADAGGQCTLRAAIEEANSNSGDTDTINFSVSGTINLTGPLPSLTNMNLNGPGSSQLTIRRNTGGDYRVLTINGFIVNISGLTITNGKTADGTAAPFFGNSGGEGAGIMAVGTVTMNDVVVTANRTGNGGPGDGSGFGGSGGQGGGIFGGGTLTLTNVTISNNITGNGNTGTGGGSGGRGGGIFFSGTSLTMTNTRVIGNTTGNGAAGTNGGASGGGGGDGAGVLVNSGTLTMNVVVLGQNHSGDANFGGTGGVGGGLMTMPGVNSTLTDVTADSNTTGNGGGGTTGQGGRGAGIANHGIMNIRSSTVSNNVTGTAGTSLGDSGGVGGGIFNGAAMTLVNTTISGNSTSGFNAPGGGFYNNGSTVTLTNCTITGNEAITHVGNGVYQSLFVSGITTVQNTIIAQNVGGPDTSGSFNSLGNNLIGNADDSTGFHSGDLKGNTATPLNALLGPLAANGGPTMTHALLAGSPALDGGNNDFGLSTEDIAPLTDQRGAGRIADSPDADSIATVDIGAYEFHQTLDSFSDQTMNEDTSLTLSFAVGDSGPAVTSVTASSTQQGLLPNANLVITGNGPVRTLTATPLANLSGTTTITLTANYSGGGTVNSAFLLTVQPVNDAPSFTKGANQTVNEDSGAKSVTNWATGITPGPGEAGQTLSFVVSNNTNPSLFSVAPAISSTGTLTFTPAANAFGSANLSVSLKDNGGTANGGQDTSAVQTFTITVNPVNDAPSFTKGADQTVAEDFGGLNVSNWATNISTGPANEGQFASFVVTNNTNPSLITSVSVGGTGLLSFGSAQNASGVADITIVAKDGGGTANGGVDTSAPLTFRITVTPVNDAPFHNFPFFTFTLQQTPLVFSTATFNAVTVVDADAGANAITMSLTATQGKMTMGSKTGLTFSAGDGTDDATMTFSGTVTAINAGLNGFAFKPNDGFSGGATIQIVLNDNGHTGAGGAKTTSTTHNIEVLSGGRFVFNTSTYGVNENGGTATITVLRSGGSAGVASVTATAAGGSATPGSSCTAGVDYLTNTKTFTWANGDTSPRTFTVSICNDSLAEGDETVDLTLGAPTGTGSLGTPATAVLTIGADDGPVLLFDPATQEAIALDLVNLTRDPFSLTNPFNMSPDEHRRISLFVWQTAPLGSNEVASVTATMRDDEFRVYQLPVEALIPVAAVPGVTQVVVRLPDSVIGAPRDMLVKVTVKGLTTNEAFIHVTAP